MLFLIDNYDSFTYNIVHYFNELDIDVRVIRNDEMTANEVLELNPSHLVLSPGPGLPSESGITMELLKLAVKKEIPTLGVCLGHEIIGEIFGGEVGHANSVMHGKSSPVYHNSSGLFEGAPNPLISARYHSLVLKKDSVPDCLEITAYTITEGKDVDEVMGVAHKTLPIYGVQFHPESVLTQQGHRIFSNFLGLKMDDAFFLQREIGAHHAEAKNVHSTF